MVLHRFTLYRLCTELDERLRGAVVAQSFSQERGRVILHLLARDGEVWLEINVNREACGVFSRTAFARAKRDTYDCFRQLVGATVNSISLDPHDRTVCINANDVQLRCLLYGTVQSNIGLFDREGHPLEWYHRQDHENQAVRATIRPELEDFGPFAEIGDALAQSSLEMGHLYSTILLEKLGIDGVSLVADFPDDDVRAIFRKARELRDLCVLGAEQFVALDPAARTQVVLCAPPESWTILERPLNVNEAVRSALWRSLNNYRVANARHGLEKHLRNRLAKLERALTAIRSEEEKEPKDRVNQLYGDLLLSLGKNASKGLQVVEVEDWLGQNHAIGLDPAKTIVENAARYFEKARSSRRASEVRRKRIPAIQKEIERYHAAIAIAQTSQDLAALEEVRKEFGVYDQKNPQARPSTEEKFRRFTLSNGTILYVGRNASNNDELTLRFARPNDIWLHARGVPGSHAVIRVTGKEDPPKAIVEEAAEIVAYYSQMRNAKLVPVIYTLKKYVRKPKGANPGSVTVEREKVVLANPKLPANSTTDDD